MGRRLVESLGAYGIDTSGLLIDTTRPTSTKTRIIAKGTQEVRQQVVRIDRVDETVVDGSLRDRMIDLVRASLPWCHALLISDYENGVVSQELLDHCLPQAVESGVTVTADSHGDLFRFRGVTAATPNQPEAAATLRMTIESEESLYDAGARLLEGMAARAVLITRGSEGVALFQPDEPPYMLPAVIANESEVVDPTGAGDTVAAVFTLALASGASARDAAHLANVAGGQVVRRLGAATVTRAELRRGLTRAALLPAR